MTTYNRLDWSEAVCRLSDVLLFMEVLVAANVPPPQWVRDEAGKLAADLGHLAERIMSMPEA